MKKILFILVSCVCLSTLSYEQKLSEKDGRKILQKAWDAVKANDSSAFIKLWVIDGQQWPYHTTPFNVNEVKTNFQDFKTFFDSAIVKNMKFDKTTCDTVERIDPHHDFATYYVSAWFKYSAKKMRGFGFYLQLINDKWYIRFSPDYLN